MFKRSLQSFIQADLEEKIVLLAGPRQVGKTTLSRSLWPDSQIYLNFDEARDRVILRKQAWSREADLVVFDEIHKWRNWKRWVKGLFDTEGNRPRILVTGSARLDVFRKGEDSLAGRHFSFRLHPLSVKEVAPASPSECLDTMLRLGSFPEPFAKNSETYAARWRRSHLDRILREDLLDLERVRDIKGLEILVQLLSERVGSPVSYSSLARDLEISPHTVKKWIQILERLYIIFVLTPYSKNIAKGLLKEPKIYFFDTGRLYGDEAARYENIVACHLLKRQHFLEDTQGKRVALHYVRDREKREVDFMTLVDGKPEWLVEVKLADDNPSATLRYFSERFKPQKTYQIVKNLRQPLQFDALHIQRAGDWLLALET